MMAKQDLIKDPLLNKTTRLTRRAWLQLVWEAYAPVFALALLISGLFLAGSFGGIWERIGDPWRAIALIFAIYFVIKAILKARQVTRPKLSAARRRVEADSGVSHRPIDTLNDTPALSEDLWPAHYQQARTASEGLKPSKLRPALKPMDPYFLRYALPAALGLSMMVGYGDNLERLRRAFAPEWTSGINAKNLSYDAWVDPPEYTGRPPIYFKNTRTAAIPAGSEMVARITGAESPPRLKLRMGGKTKYLKLKQLGPKSYEARAILNKDAKATWRIGTSSQIWSLGVLPDNPPTVSFFEQPKADKRDRLAFTYDFQDDYGVEVLELKMKLLSDDPEEADLTESVAVTLPSRSVKRADRTAAVMDMTKHIWAGRKVSAVLVAKDGLGQQAKSETAFFTVPDKIFVEPLAKAIAEQRILVMAGDAPYAPRDPLPRKEWGNQPYFDSHDSRNRLDRAPTKIQRAALLVESITIQPSGIYEDPAVYMGLKNVLGRMRYARDQEALAGIPEDLWSIAIRAEFGLLGTALEEMREAEQALAEGMARRAPQREIDTLFERYNEAVDRYTEFLRDEAIKNGDVAENEGGGGGGGGKNMDEIQELLDAIEEANRVGDTEGARIALKKLAELLENMKVELAQGGGGGGGGMSGGEMSEEMKESLEELADLLGEQRELKDETEQAENQAEQEGEGQPGEGQGGAEGENGPKPLTPGQLAQQQEALESAVDQLRQALPEEGEGAAGAQPGGEQAGGEGEESGEGGGGEEEGEGQSGGGEEEGEGSGGQGTQQAEGEGGGAGEDPNAALGRAGNAMGTSRQRLASGDLQGAAQAQAEAIEALRQAGRALADQAQGDEDGRGEGQNGKNDPLGRNENGGLDTQTDADIDTRDNATKARDLMEELRRRAAEQDRDQSERDYLERLMKRF